MPWDLEERLNIASMDFSELTKIIFNRIQKLEPENVVKIIGYILLNEPGEQEMMQLAYGPDTTIVAKINDAKTMLGMLSPNSCAKDQMQLNMRPPAVAALRTFSAPAHVPSQYWDSHLGSAKNHHVSNLGFGRHSYPDSLDHHYSLRSQAHFYGGIDDQMDNVSHLSNYYYSDASLTGGTPPRTSRRSSSLSELPRKACHYFIKGYCKHGERCEYTHYRTFPDSYMQLLKPGLNDARHEEYISTPASLETLEMEITELLRSRGGLPVSIASLPMLYYEMYGKGLQADGYLTESQRHGKAGYSLTKLLARLKNSIRVIDRPHGQHSVVLAEDAAKYTECKSERCDPGAVAASSHQIYLTFPAESTFTEDDVASYFGQYGPVRDVRIPCQDKRMFGFVSFLTSEAVNTILMKRNPHYICGARVLVKPYREKSRNMERTYMEKMKPINCYPSQYLELDPEFFAVPRESDSSKILKKQLIEEQEKMIELERRRLSDFSLDQMTQLPYLTYNLEDFKVSEDPNEFHLGDHFSFALDALNGGSTSDEKARQSNSTYSDQESNQIELPESPFTSPPLGSSISAVI
ncbi:zinc finger CCCH domain-containing protein 18-like [Typha latifolia]|uniref:zinc finger CCCH domain-containing protein 18-like n=1 Tax=Typha latifolia TaxID=4733 RepID=UPI003C2C08F1